VVSSIQEEAARKKGVHVQVCGRVYAVAAAAALLCSAALLKRLRRAVRVGRGGCLLC
jgi:hypothetical protein